MWIGIGPKTLRNHSELGKNLPLIGLTFIERQHRSAVVSNITNGELQQQHVVMIALQLRRHWQNHIGVTRRFVEIQINTDHQLEFFKSIRELTRVRRRQNRIAGNSNKRLNSDFTSISNFFSHRRSWVLAHHFWITLHFGFSTTTTNSKSATFSRCPASRRST